MINRFKILSRSAALGLFLLGPFAASSQAQGTSPAAPPLQNLPNADQTKAYAQAEGAYLVPDLGVVAKLFSGEEAVGSELSLGGFAFLEAFSGLMMQADSGAAGAENPVKFEIFRKAREGIVQKIKDGSEARRYVAQIGRFRARLATANTPVGLVNEWKALLAEEPADSAGAKDILTLPVTKALASSVGGFKVAEGFSKEPILHFLRQQKELAQRESSFILPKKKKEAPKKEDDE